MDEDGGAELGRPLEDGKERRIGEVPVEDVRSDLHAGQPQLAHAAIQLQQRQVGRLHRQRAQTHESARVSPAERGDVIVEEPRQIVTLPRRQREVLVLR